MIQGVLSAAVLSLVPMIRPFQWQSLFLPVSSLAFIKVPFQISPVAHLHIPKVIDRTFQVLPGRMLDFLDAPVPYIVSTILFNTL